MNAAITQQATKPEQLGYYPSQHITGEKVKSSSLYMSDFAMKFIFEELGKMVDADSRGEVDGERYEMEWGVYHIEAVHHFESVEREGGDSYMGYFESYVEIVRDIIEIIEVWDTLQDKASPWLMARLNKYAQRNLYKHV